MSLLVIWIMAPDVLKGHSAFIHCHVVLQYVSISNPSDIYEHLNLQHHYSMNLESCVLCIILLNMDSHSHLKHVPQFSKKYNGKSIIIVIQDWKQTTFQNLRADSYKSAQLACSCCFNTLASSVAFFTFSLAQSNSCW